MSDLLTDLNSIQKDFYDNKDIQVLEIWKECKFKWFFPKYRKRQIEKSLFMLYLMRKNMIKENYLSK